MKIELQELNLTVSSIEGPILKSPLTISIERGESVRVTGANGCGKSTLLRVLSGFHKDYTGEYFVDGQSARTLSPMLIRQAGLIYLPQHSFLFTSLSVKEFLQLLRGRCTVQTAVSRLRDVLNRINRRSKLLAQSGGIQQLLGLLSIVAQPASFYLLDEPFRHLDFHVQEEVTNLLKVVFANSNHGLILVDHQNVLRDGFCWDKTIHL